MKTLTDELLRIYVEFSSRNAMRKGEYAWLMVSEDVRQVEREAGVKPEPPKTKLTYQGLYIIEASNLPPGAPRIGIIRTDTLYPKYSGASLH